MTQRCSSATRLLFAGAAASIGAACAAPQLAAAGSSPSYGSDLVSDLKYTANNIEADLEDILTSPLHVGELFAEDGLLRKPEFYYTVLGAGAALGGAFALDETVHAHLHDMPIGVPNGLRYSGELSITAGAATLYGYGLFSDDARARETALTGGLGALISALTAEGMKVAFGRLRPREDQGAFRFFDHGKSFVSSEVAPVFSGAAALSDYFDDRWYVLIPAYATGVATGLGRIGANAHWLSDVVGAGMLGIGSAELFLYLHRRHAENPERFRIFPVASPQMTGLVVALDW